MGCSGIEVWALTGALGAVRDAVENAFTISFDPVAVPSDGVHIRYSEPPSLDGAAKGGPSWRHLLMFGEGAGAGEAIDRLLETFRKWCEGDGVERLEMAWREVPTFDVEYDRERACATFVAYFRIFWRPC